MAAEPPAPREPPRIRAATPKAEPPAPQPRLLAAPPSPRAPPAVGAREPRREPPGPAPRAREPPPPAPREPPRPAARTPRAEPPETGIDPLEALLGATGLRDPGPGPVLVLAERPLDPRYEYQELLKRIAREAYRVASRAPAAMVLHAARRLTEYQLAALRGSAGVYSIDLDAVADSEAGGAALTRLANTLEDRLAEAYAAAHGVLILYGSRARLARIRSLWRPRLGAAGAVYTRLPRAEEARIREDPAAFELLEALYALPPGSLRDASSLDDATVRAEERLHNCLRSHAADPTLGRIVKPAIDDEESRPDEAPIHYGLKAAIVAHLLEMGERETSIDTEVAVSNTPVDVFLHRGWATGLVAEAETLYGTVNPASRLRSLIASRTALGYRLWVVLAPPTAGIYLPWIEPTLLKAEQETDTVEAYILDTGTCLLQPLREYTERVKQAAQKLAKHAQA